MPALLVSTRKPWRIQRAQHLRGPPMLEGLLQPGHRCRRAALFVVGLDKTGGPKTFRQKRSPWACPKQRCSARWRSGARDAKYARRRSYRVLVGPVRGRNEGVPIEARPKPGDEFYENDARPRTLPRHLLEDLRPAFADAVEPVAKTPVTAGGMRELMRQHGFEFLGAEALHQRQPEQRDNCGESQTRPSAESAPRRR